MRQDTAYADEHKYGYRGSEIIRTKHGEPIYAKTEGQQRLVEAIANNDIIFVNGPSGTGKTAISTWLGIAGIDRGIYKHLVLTRPVVTSGEEIGFLPGTMDEKVAPYMEPLYSAISLIKGRRDEKPVESKEQLPVDLSTKEKRKKRGCQQCHNSTAYSGDSTHGGNGRTGPRGPTVRDIPHEALHGNPFLSPSTPYYLLLSA
jgi:hypothetical protein